MISNKLIKDVLLASLSTGGDFAELFIENTYNTQLKMINGVVEDSVSGRDFGVGIRIFSNVKVVYAYTNEISPNNLVNIALEAAAALTEDVKMMEIILNRITIDNKHSIKEYPRGVSQTRKVEVMKRAHNEASNYDSLITQVAINYLDNDQEILIANSDGLLVQDQRVRTRLGIQTIASKDGEKQSGLFGPGKHCGFEFFEQLDVENYAREAARIATAMVNASYLPGGKMPVVLNNGFGGVIFHEACGHALEATSVAKKTSVFTDKVGEQIASPLVTAVDDGTIPNAWGSQNIDDEGTKTQRNLLIENGILRSYLVDKLNGRKMNMKSTGSARRSSYRYAPTSRMTNTFICNGHSSPEEIIKKTERGLFANHMGGGSVNPITGEFNFAVNEGYVIRDGKLAEPIRGATLIGKGADVLKQVDMVADNLDTGQGLCGSISGVVPTDVGQPMIRVAELTVGGRGGDG